MDNPRFIHLVALKLANEASEIELRELEELMESNSDYKDYYLMIASLSLGKKYVPANVMINGGMDLVWEKIRQQEQASLRRRRFMGSTLWLGIAASIVLLVGASLFIPYVAGKYAAVRTNTVRVPNGKTYKLTLSDGSSVRLNSGSTLVYPITFKDSIRQVELIGEGYFDIAPDKAHPFIVKTDKINVRVLGTIFNLRAYPDDDNVETALLQGKIEVELPNVNKKWVLNPLQKLSVEGKSNPLIKLSAIRKLDREDKMDTETAWLQNILAFENESFGELAKKLERRYDVQIIFKDPRLKAQLISGVFEKETLEQSLDILTLTTPFTYEVKGKVIYFDSIAE